MWLMFNCEKKPALVLLQIAELIEPGCAWMSGFDRN